MKSISKKKRDKTKCGYCEKTIRNKYVYHCLGCNLILCRKCIKVKCPHGGATQRQLLDSFNKIGFMTVVAPLFITNAKEV